MNSIFATWFHLHTTHDYVTGRPVMQNNPIVSSQYNAPHQHHKTWGRLRIFSANRCQSCNCRIGCLDDVIRNRVFWQNYMLQFVVSKISLSALSTPKLKSDMTLSMFRCNLKLSVQVTLLSIWSTVLEGGVLENNLLAFSPKGAMLYFLQQDNLERLLSHVKREGKVRVGQNWRREG